MTARWNVGAVLFDMDGTLLDTERIYFDSMVGAMQSLGYGGDAVALCHGMVGLTGPERETLLHARYGEEFPIAEINRAYVRRRDETLAAGLLLKRGALELLDALQAEHYPLAVVTSSLRRTAESRLSSAGIRDRFETILTRDDVSRVKPSPDLYLLAAARFGFDPERCVAVEDSNHGVESALAAGAITIMVPDLVPPNEASRTKCAAVLSDLGAVREMLQTRCRLERRSGSGV